MKNVFEIEKINKEEGTVRVVRLCVSSIDEYYQGNHDICEWATVEYKENEKEQKEVIANCFGINVDTIELIY